jgi:hypothetical protein
MGNTDHSVSVKSLAVIPIQNAELCLADSRRVLQHNPNTGFNSPGEREMTLKTSEVAVCCSSASVSSRVRACTSSNNRVFSIAITAWSAKASSNAT